MKRIIFTLAMAVSMSASTFAQQDAEGTKDHPMFPNRMSNYFRSEYESNFDAVNFYITQGGGNEFTKEGNKTRIKYDFNFESGQQKPSALQIFRNYETAVKKIGGDTKYLSASEGVAVFKIVKWC
jgi:uncharacterized protein YxeA